VKVARLSPCSQHAPEREKGIPSFDKLDIPFVMIMKPHTGKVQGYKVLFHKILK